MVSSLLWTITASSSSQQLISEGIYSPDLCHRFPAIHTKADTLPSTEMADSIDKACNLSSFKGVLCTDNNAEVRDEVQIHDPRKVHCRNAQSPMNAYKWLTVRGARYMAIPDE